ncbi:hypothetical protein CLAVI_000535 [Candidatus Clavichlamydia salmonicola]|uniref:hypothetical protein n=1 Tax=Candidatus Clavichlamydia salmonicola TaxID=469812 RepID=UPI00189185B5|nr:hypothetical protein [Candidatus Clavichlamydia salmonicola]MBF5050913.1 hypothetical protein [Candidatus Clavichlamydia salmonicola]
MSFISNIFGFRPPTSLSQAVRNYQRNINRLCRFPGLQAAVSSVMGVSMAVLTSEILAGDPLDSQQHSLSHHSSPAILGMKIATLTVMTIANGFILGEAVASLCGDTSITALNVTTPNRNRQLYILTGLNLAGSSFGLISIVSFVCSSALQNQHPNPLQTVAITSGSLSSTAYIVEAVISLLMCSGRTVAERRVDHARIRYQQLDDSDDEPLINLTMESDFGNDSDDDSWTSGRVSTSSHSTATLVEIE